MTLCLSLFALSAVLGYLLHRWRVRTLERRFAESASPLAISPTPVERPADAPASELVAFDRAKSRILAGLVNELRTPLMLIMGPLQERSAASENSAFDAALLEQALTLRHRVEQLGTALDHELGDRELHQTRGDLSEVMAQQASAVRPAAERHGVSFDFHGSAEEAWLPFDRHKIEQAILGLLQRSFADTRPGDTIHFTTRVVAGSISPEYVVEIQDDGAPMDERYRRLLTEEGHWAEYPDAMQDLLGLSLALSRSFVRLHGGRIEVDADAEEGTVVRLILPLPSMPQRSSGEVSGGDALPNDHEIAAFLGEEAESAAPDNSGGTPEDVRTTVLVVDDHDGTRGYLSFALRKHHRVLEARNGIEALALVKEHVPDLVISDVMMPGMDGRALCRAIKEDRALNHIPVFLVTANAVPDARRDGLASGADDYLTKPFDLDEATMRINNMINTRGRLRQRFSREVVIKPSDITVTSADEVFLDRARLLIEENIDESNFGVQELASELGLSPRQLQRRLRETVDQSPVEFIRTLRLQRAAQLLDRQYGNVSEVAYSVGFTSLSYFAKCFREQFGQSPSEYKAEQAA